jgi:epoxyqueuosine reductase
VLNKHQYKSFIQQQATALGFSHCGFAKAEPLYNDAKRLEKWLKNNYEGKMGYMENHFDLRIDPTKLVPGAKSVITLLLNYYTTQKQDGDLKISKYAYGKDYHDVIRQKLNTLIAAIESNIGKVEGRGFVDSAPVLERTWATKSGLGWVGKNGNLINKQNGSFFFIATLITDLDIEPDTAFTNDYCGTCTKCIDACPTEAILPNKEINGSKCISYYTIELKDALLPETEKGKFDNWMFGCDTCQDVCPWNRFAKQHTEDAFKPINEILHYSTEDWEQLTQEQFSKIFKNSAIKRTKYSGLARNIKFLASPPSKGGT